MCRHSDTDADKHIILNFTSMHARWLPSRHAFPRFSTYTVFIKGYTKTTVIIVWGREKCQPLSVTYSPQLVEGKAFKSVYVYMLCTTAPKLLTQLQKIASLVFSGVRDKHTIAMLVDMQARLLITRLPASM